jgi:hypothetical protein
MLVGSKVAFGAGIRLVRRYSQMVGYHCDERGILVYMLGQAGRLVNYDLTIACIRSLALKMEEIVSVRSEGIPSLRRSSQVAPSYKAENWSAQPWKHRVA